MSPTEQYNLWFHVHIANVSIILITVNKVVLNAIKNNAKKKNWEESYPFVKDGMMQTVGMVMSYGLIHLPQ